jgi:hypothetical protein
MSFSFSLTARYGDCFTPNTGPSAFPVYWIPIQFYDQSRRSFPQVPERFLWDTGASFCTISIEMANAYQIDFDDKLDRVEGGIDGMGGNRDTWLTTARIRFPRLTRPRRFLGMGAVQPANLCFDFTILIVEHLSVPLMGASDMLRNFTVTATWDSCQFQLNADHLGMPTPDGATP